jgi:hypothetical protein
MHARVPQDVDLEDRLIFGLTPTRFGYVVVAALGALALWRAGGQPPWLPGLPCLLLLAGGASLAWGRWQGRPADRWLADLAVHGVRNYRLLGRAGRQAPVALPSAPPAAVPLGAIATIASAPGQERGIEACAG